MIFQSNYDVNNVFFRIIGGVMDYCVIALNATFGSLRLFLYFCQHEKQRNSNISLIPCPIDAGLYANEYDVF